MNNNIQQEQTSVQKHTDKARRFVEEKDYGYSIAELANAIDELEKQIQNFSQNKKTP